MKGARDYRFARRTRPRSPLAGVAVSFVIILVGLAMLFDNLGIIRGRDLWDFAPALLIAFGVLKVIECRERPSGAIFGGLLIVGGSLWLLDNLGFIRFNPGLILPMILIAIGVSALLRNLERQQILRDGAAPPPTDGNTVSLFAVFGGSKRGMNTQEFRGGDALAIFGGVELDLRGAAVGGPSAIFEATAIFGGVELRVPQTWNVTMRGIGIFGGYEDKTQHPANSDAPELVITGNAIFGGVSISN